MQWVTFWPDGASKRLGAQDIRNLAIGMPDADKLDWSKHLNEEDLSLSLGIIHVLRSLGSAELLNLSFKQEALRVAALRALYDFKGKDAIEVVAKATKDPAANIRKTAFAVLVGSETPSATETLLSLASKAEQMDAHVEAMNHCFQRIAVGKVPEKARGAIIGKLLTIARRLAEKRLALAELQKVPSMGALASAHALIKESSLGGRSLLGFHRHCRSHGSQRRKDEEEGCFND